MYPVKGTITLNAYTQSFSPYLLSLHGQKRYNTTKKTNGNGTLQIPHDIKETTSVPADIEDNGVDIIEDDGIHPQWLAMEKRVKLRKTRLKAEGIPSGRSPRRGSAWDGEHV
eukprot:CAMPEP_0174954588 /NCGR_PEP_ID=MMETSP0004_2-20121128/509_1 /TAXON_ID=420556 /ORGANISM="Ochromonas sp., Strain CCMP1393" /LENGTH=111 /DNA_ID=CAMNT_0016202421 /DNA_START=207 /DNA_END=542 /DNA_ORIENTATION=+